MFENDYIMRMILQLTRALRRSLNRQYPTVQEEIDDIEGRVAEAVDLDPRLMFSLAPESLVSILQLGNFVVQLGGYVVRSLLYEADLLESNGELKKAELRREQAWAINDSFAGQIAAADATPAALEEFLGEMEAEATDSSESSN